MVCPAKAAADQVDDGKLKVLPQKLTGSRSRGTPKQEDAANTKVVSRAAATEKVKALAWLCVDERVCEL